MHRAWHAFSRMVRKVNYFTGLLSGSIIVVSSVLVTNEVLWRYYLKLPHAWNLEANIFLLIGATFLGANYTQMKRGHVACDVIDAFMSANVNRWRMVLVDFLSFLFCIFVAVKAWEHAHSAWVGGWSTPSLWAPPLWIPFFLMSFGLSLLSLEYVVQLVEDVANLKSSGNRGAELSEKPRHDSVAQAGEGAGELKDGRKEIFAQLGGRSANADGGMFPSINSVSMAGDAGPFSVWPKKGVQ